MNMWIKNFFFVIFLAPVLIFSAEQINKEKTLPEEKNTAEKKTEKSTPKVTPLTKKEREALLQELAMERSKFNPRLPGLTVAHVQKVLLKDIFDVLIDKRIPDDPRKIKKSGETITYLGTRMALFKYGVLLKNPELPEVTNIKLVWYKAYETKLKKMEELARKLDQASASGDLALYQQIKAQIEAYQKVLKDFANGKKIQFSSDEMRALKRKNMLWRTAEFKKRQTEKLKKAGLASVQLKDRKIEEVKSSRNQKNTAVKSVKNSGSKKSSSNTSAGKHTRKRKNAGGNNW
ncbi:MAG: hypothetical protein J6S53_09065 [Lentisphaeria bacterium]|nr:hypothetical protein [Lentisphaeria bacterium]